MNILQEFWRSLSQEQREKAIQKLEIPETTFWRYRQDPGQMRLSTAIKICNYFAIENPRDLLNNKI